MRIIDFLFFFLIVTFIFLFIEYIFVYSKPVNKEKFKYSTIEIGPQSSYYDAQGSIIGPNDKSIYENGLNTNLCSPSCCGNQWAVPFKLPIDGLTCTSEDDYIPSNYFCSNSTQNSGCVCLKKSQDEYLNNRGQI
jgi:hypothetical protein